MIKQLAAATVMASALTVITLGPSVAGAATTGGSRTMQATDTAHLHYVPPAHGPLLLEEGTASGTIPGTMRVHVTLGSTFRATFTIYTRAGSISGRGMAVPHGLGIYESFAGTLVITSGTGRYAHAHGHAGLYGTFDRRTYGLVVQTTGSLSY